MLYRWLWYIILSHGWLFREKWSVVHCSFPFALNTRLWVLMTSLKGYEGWFSFERLVSIYSHDFSLKYEGKKKSTVLHFLPSVFQILVSFLFWILEESRTLTSVYVTLSSQNSRKYVRKVHAINNYNFIYTHMYIYIYL